MARDTEAEHRHTLPLRSTSAQDRLPVGGSRAAGPAPPPMSPADPASLSPEDPAPSEPCRPLSHQPCRLRPHSALQTPPHSALQTPPLVSPADPASLQARPPPAWGRCQRIGFLRPGSPGPPRSASKGRLCPSRKQVPVPRAPQAAWTQGDILSPGDPAEPMPAEAGGAGPAPNAGPGSGNGGSKGPLASAPPAQSRRYCRAPRAPAPGPGPGSLQSPRALGAPQSGQRSRPASSRPSAVGPVQQAPGVWLHQDGCAPAFRGDNTHPPSPAWTSPGGMHHRAGDKAWGGEATSKTVWEPLGVTVSRQGPPCSPAASPAWAPPWSSSQPGSLPTPSRPGLQSMGSLRVGHD